MGWSALAPKVRRFGPEGRSARRARADPPSPLRGPTPRTSNLKRIGPRSGRPWNGPTTLWRSRFGATWESSGRPLDPFAGKPVSLGRPDWTQKIYQSYFLKCAHFYNQQSLSIITNWIIDLVTLLFFFVLLILLTPQILILKTFCIESLLSLSETTKCFFLIFFLDLLVGFHSSKSWEIFLQFFIEHFGFQIHPNFIAFFISTFPVLLDTIFKYWIFRYLNKISPSTVATYQAMIE